MRAKKFVTALAAVALMSGGMAFAAERGTVRDQGNTEIHHDKENQPQRMERQRQRRDQRRNPPPPQVGVRPLDVCADSPMARGLAGLFGLELERICDDN